MRPGDKQLRGDEHPDTGLGEKSWTEHNDQRFHRLLEISALNREVVDAGRGAPQGELGCGEFRVRRGVESKPLAAADELTQR